MAGQTEREGVMTEADTCREFVTPRLVEAGWSSAPYAIGERRSFTNGRIIVAASKSALTTCRTTTATTRWLWSRPRKSAYPPKPACSRRVNTLKSLASTTNGSRIIEIDYTAGAEREVDRYAMPDELFARLPAILERVFAGGG
jgi:type I restriction enzyme R subunit